MTDTDCEVVFMYDKSNGRVTKKFNNDITEKLIKLKKRVVFAAGFFLMRKAAKDLVTWWICLLLHEDVNKKIKFYQLNIKEKQKIIY